MRVEHPKGVAALEQLLVAGAVADLVDVQVLDVIFISSTFSFSSVIGMSFVFGRLSIFTSAFAGDVTTSFPGPSISTFKIGRAHV